jgi:murein DD-endopeptidase MepM/ murein hydrolase activator NlpD
VASVGLALLVAYAAAPTGAEPRMQIEQVHAVQWGDTLYGIGRLYGVTVNALVLANRLSGESALIRVGQRLVIPRSPLATPRASAARPAPLSPPPLRVPLNLVLSLPDFGDRLPLFSWPAEGRVSSTFGRRSSGWHRGVDIRAERGAPIMASAPGVVVASGVEPRYGRVVKIEHPGRFVTVYAHNDRNLVEIGARVLGGQTIAVMGRTGRATADHVHFEIRHAGLAYNPLYMLPLPPRVAVVEDDDSGDHDESGQ